MKKFLLVVLAVIFFISSVPASAGSNSSPSFESQRIIVYNPETKCYEEITASSITTLPDGRQLIISDILNLSFSKASGGVTSSKSYYFVNNNNVLEWRVTLTASFTFDGTSATCTSASSVTTVYQGNWSESSNNTYPSYNSAIAQVTVVRKVLFIVVETQNVFLTITCDGNGHVS